MFDVSCLFGTSEFATIQQDAYNIWNGCEASITDPLDPTLVSLFQNSFNISVVGQHYFVNGDNQTLTPVFDFTSSGSTNGNPGAIFFGKKIEDVSSPDGNNNVDWLELQETSGQLANYIFRVYTVQGQPPDSVSSSLLVPLPSNQLDFSLKCNPGSADITVKYATKYCTYSCCDDFSMVVSNRAYSVLTN
jgi:Protein of unknown function (DUF3455)